MLLRDQIEMLFVFHPKNHRDLKIINDENGIMSDEELILLKDQFKKSKHVCLYARLDFPEEYKILNGLSTF